MKAERQIEKAEQLGEDGDVEEAIALLDEVLAAKLPKGTRVQALMARASIYDDVDDHERAIADCNAALVLDPKSPDVYYLRAVIYQGAENWRAAKVDVDAAIAIEPEADYYEVRGLCSYNLGDYAAARADFAIAIRDNENIDTSFFVYRGMAAILTNEPAAAIDDFTNALEREPDNVKALGQRAKAYEACGNVKAALADLARLRPLIPKSPMLEAHRKHLRAQLKQKK